MVGEIDYYARLNIEPDATKADIKRAYFKLVKQYPPESYPEEFKAYRKAYEVLYDNDARTEYDHTYKMLPIEKAFFEEANKYIQLEEYEHTIKILKEAKRKFPKNLMYDELLGEVYLLSDHTGNAVKIYQELVLQKPSNTKYQRKLGDAYKERGFTKKAIAQYEKSIQLAPEHVWNWLGLGECYKNEGQIEQAWNVFERGEPHFAEYGPDSMKFHLAVMLFSIAVKEEDQYTKEFAWLKLCLHQDSVLVKELIEELKNWQNPRAIDSRWTAKAFFQLYQFLLELAPDDEHIVTSFEDLQFIQGLILLEEDERIQIPIADLTNSLDNECNCPYCLITRGILEMEILGALPYSKKELRILKEEYPNHYEKHKTFYDQVLNSRKERRLMDQTILQLSRLAKKNPIEYEEVLKDQNIPSDMIYMLNNVLGVDARIRDEYDDWDWDEPVITKPFVRESPKVGRNDPCPCGSGKKYKKCCGA